MTGREPVTDIRRRIRAAYDPELLRSAGAELSNQLADHLSRIERSRESVLNWNEPEENIAIANSRLDGSPLSPDDRQSLADRNMSEDDLVYIGEDEDTEEPLKPQVLDSAEIRRMMDQQDAIMSF